MARISTEKTGGGAAAKPAKAKPADAGGDAGASKRRPLARRRGTWLVLLGVAALFIWGVKLAWQSVAPALANRERYIVAAERITISGPPEWIVADVRGQVIHSAGLDRRLSILDADFVEKIRHAFALHPWVQSVDRIEKKYPPGAHVELTYRQPLAVVETIRGELLPVDANGSHLPGSDVPLIRRKYLPRIIGIVGQPPIGQRWEDPRLKGAVEIVISIGAQWEPLHLDLITPRARPEISGERQFFVYDIVTRGGTQIVWGASPHAQAPGEAKVVEKMQRLQRCIDQYGPLDSEKSPGTVDIRGELHVEPRMVKQPAPRGEEKTVVK